MADETRRTGKDANRDPITGTPGSHPVGTGLGAARAARRQGSQARRSRVPPPARR